MQVMLDQIGGADKLRELVDRFYDLVETDPRGRAILDMHLKGHGLAHVRPEQFDFLSGFLGGPRYYQERHGHMNLREIHAHVEIRPEDATDWLALMARAMQDVALPQPQAEQILATFRRAAMMLVNRPSGSGAP